MPLSFALAKNIPIPVKLRSGSRCFPQARRCVTKKPTSRDGIISILRLFSVLCMKQSCVREFRNQSTLPTQSIGVLFLQGGCSRFSYHLLRFKKRRRYENLRTNRLPHFPPLICNAPYKSFSATAMLKPLWFTPMF